MIHLTDYKDLTAQKPIEILPLPETVYIPLSQHTGKICIEEVKVGDRVLTGQRIGFAAAAVFSPVHASLSGEVIAIRDYPHPALGQCRAIEIRSDSKDEIYRSQVTGLKSQVEVDRLSVDEIRDIIFEAGIVGLGGAAFPTHIKLNPPKPVEVLIINLAECEPYLTCDYRLALENSVEILKGIQILAKILAVKKTILAIEDNKPEVIKKFRAVLAEQAFGKQLWQAKTKVEITVLKTQYPQGGEKQLIKSILNKEVPSGKLPFDIGAVVHNVATVFAIYEAIYKNKPLYERVVTVSGSCLSNPRNLLTRIGSPIKSLIDFCGPLKEEPAKIIIGGPMMGIAQYSDEVPVIKSTTGIILMNKKEAQDLEEEFCIRCGACVRECPAGLMPCLINLASEKSLWPEAKNYGVIDCIECGLCNYVCPANRRLVQSIKRAKLELA